MYQIIIANASPPSASQEAYFGLKSLETDFQSLYKACKFQFGVNGLLWIFFHGRAVPLETLL